MSTNPAKKVIDQAHSMLHEGYAFTYQDVVTLSASENHELLLYTSPNSEVHFAADVTACSGETFYRLWESPQMYIDYWGSTSAGAGSLTSNAITASISASMTAGGTCASVIANRNRQDAKSCQLSISAVKKYAPAVAAASGTRLAYREMGLVAAGQAQSKAPGSGIPLARPEWILRGGPTGAYYFVQIGSRTAGNKISFDLEWYQD